MWGVVRVFVGFFCWVFLSVVVLFVFFLKPRMLKPLVLIFSKVKIPLVDVS